MFQMSNAQFLSNDNDLHLLLNDFGRASIMNVRQAEYMYVFRSQTDGRCSGKNVEQCSINDAIIELRTWQTALATRTSLKARSKTTPHCAIRRSPVNLEPTSSFSDRKTWIITIVKRNLSTPVTSVLRCQLITHFFFKYVIEKS